MFCKKMEGCKPENDKISAPKTSNSPYCIILLKLFPMPAPHPGTQAEGMEAGPPQYGCYFGCFLLHMALLPPGNQFSRLTVTLSLSSKVCTLHTCYQVHEHASHPPLPTEVFSLHATAAPTPETLGWPWPSPIPAHWDGDKDVSNLAATQSDGTKSKSIVCIQAT